MAVKSFAGQHGVRSHRCPLADQNGQRLESRIELHSAIVVALHPTGRRGICAALVNLFRRGAHQLAQVGVPVQPTTAAREFAGLQHADCHPAAGVQQASIRGD